MSRCVKVGVAAGVGEWEGPLADGGVASVAVGEPQTEAEARGAEGEGRSGETAEGKMCGGRLCEAPAKRARPRRPRGPGKGAPSGLQQGRPPEER